MHDATGGHVYFESTLCLIFSCFDVARQAPLLLSSAQPTLCPLTALLSPYPILSTLPSVLRSSVGEFVSLVESTSAQWAANGSMVPPAL